jgi:hypothetical protein
MEREVRHGKEENSGIMFKGERRITAD